MRRTAGFSLLEVLAALALLAILLLGVYSGVRSTTLATGHGSAAIARLDEVRGAREFLRRQLASATAMPWTFVGASVPLVFEGDARHMRFVSTLPGYLGKLGPQVIEVALSDGEEGGPLLQARFEPLPNSQSKVTEGARDVLLSRVHALRLRYAARGSTAWQDRWTEPMVLPGAVEISLMPEEGEAAWPPLIVAVRQDPEAVNVRAAARRLPDPAL
jgi:general secretion pathway protein J